MVKNWVFNETDELFTERLSKFIPEMVFDSHAHLYRLSDLNIEEHTYLNEGPEESDYTVWKEKTGKIVKGSILSGGLFFPMVSQNCDIGRSNEFLLEQLKKAVNSKGLILVSPDYSADKIAEFLKNPMIAGFKPYFYFSKEKPINEASIQSFLPEWIWELAHHGKLVITLHIVKRKALAHPENQKTIIKMCIKYPDARLILAHAARGFHPENTINGLAAISELDNIWFDTSAICEAKALKAVLKSSGPKKLLWGTDFPDSQIHGKCVSLGDGFVWIDNTAVNWEALSSLCNPVLFGIESLLALKDAIEELGLNKEDIKDIFYNNAMKLFGLKC